MGTRYVHALKAGAMLRNGSSKFFELRASGMHEHVVLPRVTAIEAKSIHSPYHRQGQICTNCGYQSTKYVVDGFCIGECKKW